MSRGGRPFRFAWERAVMQSDLRSTVRHVAHVLGTYANIDGTSAHPGIERLATGTGYGKRTVGLALVDLRAAGYVERVRFSNSKAGISDVYRLTMPGPRSASDAHGAHLTTLRGASDDTPPDQYQPTITNPLSPGEPAAEMKEETVDEEEIIRRYEMEIAELVKHAPGFEDEPEIARAPQKVLDLDHRDLRRQRAHHDTLMKLEGTSEDDEPRRNRRPRYGGLS